MIYTPFVWPLLIAAAIVAGIALYVRRFRDVPGTRLFSLLMWLGALWALLCALNVSTVSLPPKILWAQLQLLPVAFMPPTILALALAYIGQAQWLTRPRLLLLLAIPVMAILLLLSSGYHTLFRYDFQLDLSGPVPVLLTAKGPLYWVYIAYSVALVLIASGLLVISFRVRTLYFRNTLAITLAILIPTLANLLYNFGITPIHDYDLTPTTFIFSGALLIWALLRFRLFDVTPVARNTVMENMDDLVFVLDTRGHLVDFNHAAQAACGLSPERSIGVTPDTLPPDWAGLFQRYHDVSACKEEVTIGPAERQRVYDLTVSPVQDGRSRTLGRLFLLHDVTERTRGEEELRRAKEEWEYTFDAVPDLIALLDTEHRIVRVNRAMAERLGHRPEECVGQICYKCIHGTAAPPAFCPHTQLLQDGNAHEAEVHEERLGGDYIVTVSPLRDAHGQLVGCVHVAHDITARKQAEEIIQLRLKLLEFAATHSLDELMQHALDEIGRITSSPIGFYHFVEADQKTLSLQAWSTRTRQEFCKAEGQGLHYSIDEAGVWVDCVHQRKPVIHNNYAALPHRKGMPPGHAEVIRELVVPILREGRVVSILGVGNKPFDYDDQDVAFVSYTADIIWETVKRKRAEESLREANLVVENSPVVLFRWKATEGWPVEMVSQNVSQLGYTPEELLSGAAPFASMVYPEDLDRVAREVQEYAASGTDQFQQEYRIVTKDGRVRWIDDRTSVERNIAGQIVFYQGVVIDITARKQAEEQLRASLQEKEVLLQEVHHRVKNNLQVISSLLDIQTLQNPDPQVLQALRDSQSRIRTMALVHEQLYRSADLARVNLADYIRNLASYLFSVYADRAAGVTLDVQVEDVTLGLDAAIPCGLIVGELVSNALKYAFPLTGDTPPARGVRIAMRSPGAGQFVLTISDNGVGLPPNLDVQDPPTLGLRLVSLLTQQLQGTLAVERQPGTAFTIAFAERKRGREKEVLR